MNTYPLNDGFRARSLSAFFLLFLGLGTLYVGLAAVRALPVAALNYFGAFLPAITALILVFRKNAAAGMVELLQRSLDYRRITSRLWLLPVFFLWPVVVAVQYGLALAQGLPVSSPDIARLAPLGIGVSFVLALGEEIGWTGYAAEPMQSRFGALQGSILLGLFWASVHLVYFASSGASPDWILWQFIYVAATRVLFIWVYNNAGRSLFAVAVMHTLFNQVWQVFPASGGLVGMSVPSFYSPMNLALSTIVLVATVTFLWGPSTLARYRYSPAGRPQPSAA
jgi:CAAX protease family protein